MECEHGKKVLPFVVEVNCLEDISTKRKGLRGSSALDLAKSPWRPISRSTRQSCESRQAIDKLSKIHMHAR